MNKPIFKNYPHISWAVVMTAFGSAFYIGGRMSGSDPDLSMLYASILLIVVGFMATTAGGGKFAAASATISALAGILVAFILSHPALALEASHGANGPWTTAIMLGVVLVGLSVFQSVFIPRQEGDYAWLRLSLCHLGEMILIATCILHAANIMTPLGLDGLHAHSAR